jgi:hypothetical protein
MEGEKLRRRLKVGQGINGHLDPQNPGLSREFFRQKKFDVAETRELALTEP